MTTQIAFGSGARWLDEPWFSGATIPTRPPAPRRWIVLSTPADEASGATVGMVTSAPIERMVETLARRLDDLLALEPGWDSYGGAPIRSDIAEAAMRLVSGLILRGVEPPTIVPGPSGSLQLEWHCDSVEAEIEISGPTELDVYVEVAGSEPQEFRVSDVPDEVVQMLPSRRGDR